MSKTCFGLQPIILAESKTGFGHDDKIWMRIFKNKLFHKWAIKEGLTDLLLRQAIEEMEKGLFDANLGGHVYKKRIGVQGRGKRGGVRTLIAFKQGDKAFFVYGFAKNQQANLTTHELQTLIGQGTLRVR